MIRTLAPQHGHMAAAARPCSVLGGYQWNAWVGMSMNSTDFIEDTTTKRPARHLGGLPT